MKPVGRPRHLPAIVFVLAVEAGCPNRQPESPVERATAPEPAAATATAGGGQGGTPGRDRDMLATILETTLTLPSPNEAAKRLQGQVNKTESPQSWEVTTPYPGLRFIVDAGDASAGANEIRVVFEVAAGVTLDKLVARLGPYASKRESKTSTARFEVKTQQGPIRIVASLLSHEVKPESPVTALSAYRVSGEAAPGP